MKFSMIPGDIAFEDIYVVVPVGEFPLTMAVRERIVASVEKWEFIEEALLEDPKLTLHDGGPDTCALCIKFLIKDEESGEYCAKCPIYVHTGLSRCRYTPYSDYSHTGWYRDAREMVSFLNMILEKYDGEVPSAVNCGGE